MSQRTIIEECLNCKKENPGPYQSGLQFEYEGFTFTFSKDGMTCEECAGRQDRELFDEFGAELVKQTAEGTLRVDWQYYVDRVDGVRYSDFYSGPRVKTQMNLLLFALGVFSFRASDNWQLVGRYGGFGPDIGIFFTQREHAEGYACAALAKDRRDWELRHIAEVISQKDILAENSAAS